MLNDLDLSSTLGMTEMEVASVTIVNMCLTNGTWLTPITYDDMKNDFCQAGFLQLLECNLIRSFYRKRDFFVTQDLIDHLIKYKPDLKDIFGPLSLKAPGWADYSDLFYKVPNDVHG